LLEESGTSGGYAEIIVSAIPVTRDRQNGRAMFQYLTRCLKRNIPIAYGSDASAVPTAAIYESTGISDYELFDIDLLWVGRRHCLSTTNACAHCDKNNGFSHGAILLELARERATSLWLCFLMNAHSAPQGNPASPGRSGTGQPNQSEGQPKCRDTATMLRSTSVNLPLRQWYVLIPSNRWPSL
jgi:hypothetical protein